jgi:hypothetical protein
MMINPAEIENAEELADQLDELRRRDGRSYQELAGAAHLSPATIHAMVNGTFPRRDSLKLFVEACGGDSRPWLEAWNRVKSKIEKGTSRAAALSDL